MLDNLKFNQIYNNIKKIKNELPLQTKLVLVTKGVSPEIINYLLSMGRFSFGENKIQETKHKWSEFRKANHNFKLHMIGHLQSNKVKQALELFDVIETIDNEKLAKKISDQLRIKPKNIELFVQVNIGLEQQKYGISPKNTKDFVLYCKNDLKLNISGLMCLPPKNSHTDDYFQKMKEIAATCALKNLSMGMSADYHSAIKAGSTQIRIGKAIFT